jgi:hypothetical protein
MVMRHRWRNLARIVLRQHPIDQERTMIRFLRLFKYVRSLEAELEETHNDLSKALCGEVTIESIVANRNECKVELGARMAGFFANSFYDMLNEVGADNYIEMTFIPPDDKPITVTIRRHNGKTPDQLYKELRDSTRSTH